MQFALPAAVEMIRTINNEQLTMNGGIPVVVNACDPANPYGLGIEIGSVKDAANIRISRLPLNYFVFDRGSPVLWIEGFGARITTVAESSHEIIRAGLEQFVSNLRASFRNEREVIVEYCDGMRPTESPLAEILQSVGFYRDRAQTMRYELQ